MDQKSIGKVRWARARAASPWQQAEDLDRNHSGDLTNTSGAKASAQRVTGLPW
jgi:hypothetical protein